MSDGKPTNDQQGAAPADGEEVYLANSQGHGFHLVGYEGTYVFKVPEEMLKGEKHVDKLRKLKDVDLGADDIIICAYAKCGTHWTWEVLEMLKSGVIKYQTDTKETRMIEIIFKEGIEALPSPRVLNTHLQLRMLPKQVREKKIKCIQVMRNPKDVCVSYFNHCSNEKPPFTYEGDFTEFTESYMKGQVYFGSYHQYLREWKDESAAMKEIPTFEMYYEDMKKDPVKCVRQVADFLGIKATDKFCEEVADACSFKKMKKADTEVKKDTVKFLKEGEGGTFYRKGEVGDWKNWFTVAASERFDQMWNEKMKDTGISFTYSLK